MTGIFFFKARNINIERNVVKPLSPSRGTEKSTLTAMRFTYTNDLAENTLMFALNVTNILNWRLSVEGLCKEQTSSLKAERWCLHTFK